MVRYLRMPGSPRIGLVVSKGSGNAAARNRIKRRLRHCVRDLELQPGNDYVIIATRQVGEVSHPVLMGWLERAVAELNDA